MNALVVQNLTMAYADTPVVENLNFEVPRACLMAIVGPNGSGKTTTLRGLIGAMPRVSGTVTFATTTKHGLVYVPQRASVDWDFPLRVQDVVAQGRLGGLGLFGRFKPEDHAAVASALQKVDLEAFADRQIGELSGGQQQRTFLARALAQDGDLYLMDEPFQGVDATTERSMIAVLHELRARGKTVVVVHHDLSTVREYFDQVLLMNRTAIACGPTHEVFTLENLQRTYSGRLAVFDGAVVEAKAPRGLA